MPCKPFSCILILLVFSCRISFADTFIVTSKADSGPGTLREAIEKANANGSAATDYIHFNIPETVYNLRIIDLVTELPALSSNIEIDGSTQPGAFYGTTEAKICVRKREYMAVFSMLKIGNAQNVRVYGMHLYYGYWQGLFVYPFRSDNLYGINIANSTDILIGEPGKGNVIAGVRHGIYSASTGCGNITIRSNYFSQGLFYTNPADDVDDAVLNSDCGITMANVKNIYIGGATPADGNVFGGRLRAIDIDSEQPTGNGIIRIQHNLFARLYDRTTLDYYFNALGGYISIGRSPNNPIWQGSGVKPDYRVELLDNDIPNDARISDISDSVIVLRNLFVYDRRKVDTKLSVRSTKGGLIGGEDAANANYFKDKNTFYAGRSIVVYDGGPVTMLKNIFYCNSTFGSTTNVYNTYGKVPFAQVDATSATNVSGRATPGARIDLYYDDKCTACEGEVYVATVQSDAAGKWSWSGTITGTIVATATKDGYTSEFSYPTFNYTAQKIVQPSCGGKNGSITGITAEGAESYFWINVQTNDTVSKVRDLLNAGPGTYNLYAVHGGTCIERIGSYIYLEDQTPAIARQADITQPSCGLSNGALHDLKVAYATNARLEWKNESGQVVGNSPDIAGLPPGKYTFYATDLNAGCVATSNTYVLVNQNGPSLNTAALQITHTTCDRTNGSIKGMTAINVTGVPFTRWVDAANKPVANGYALENVPAGTYRFKFKDQGGCDTIIVSYTINALTSFSPVTVTNVMVKDGLCGLPEGSVSIASFSADPNDYTFRWVETGSGTAMGSTQSLSNLAAGIYDLYAMDRNNCESKIYTATVKTTPKPYFDYSAVTITNDQCNLQQGGITSITIMGLITPTTYAWFDEHNNPVGRNIGTLQQIPAGTYHLKVTDGGTCVIESKTFVVTNTDVALAAPLYTDQMIARNKPATLSVRNPSAGTYTLYADAAGTTQLQQNTTGNFSFVTVTNDMQLYAQQHVGKCYSPMAPVSIKVVDRSYFTIPNAFTPNNDGHNDRLTVRIKGVIQLSYFRIYNRWGQMVFETSRLNDGWDGTCKGVLQQTGTYIWVAEGKDITGEVIKDKGSFVLIH